MSIFDRYRSTNDDALDLARKRAEALRRRRVVPQAPGTAAPRDPTAGRTVQPGDAVTPKPPGSSSGKLPRDLIGNIGDAGKGMNPDAGKAAEDELDDLARTRAEREKERKAAEEELRLGKQRAVQQADARAGLAGFGLSGATSAQVSNVARAQDRTATLTLADLDRRQRDEDFQAIQRKAALADLEDAYGEDIDGDGRIAGQLPIATGTQEERDQSVAERIADDKARAAEGYKDAPVEDIPYADAYTEYGRPVAFDGTYGYFDTGAGVVKVRK